MEEYLKLMAWWNSKTNAEKLAIVGIETLDKWVEGIIRDDTLNTEVPAPIPASVVIKSLQKRG